VTSGKEAQVASRSSNSAARWLWILLVLDRVTALGQSEASPALARTSVLGHRDPRLIEAVSKAVQGATLKLQEQRCNQVFSDFRDGEGKTLQQNLQDRGETGQSFLLWLIFYNGTSEGICRESGTVAATNPGARMVHVCPSQFVQAQFATPGYASALIIHEELHALGLKENPPTSREITLGVISRCGQ
jgi:hypothetical protein